MNNVRVSIWRERWRSLRPVATTTPGALIHATPIGVLLGGDSIVRRHDVGNVQLLDQLTQIEADGGGQE
jgi:hypothetical protein